MTCLDVDPLLNAYFDGELDLSGSLEVERHLSECAACAVQYRNLGRLHDVIAGADLDYGARANTARLRRSILRRVYGWMRWTSVFRAPWIPALAAAVLLFAAILPVRLFTARDQTGREVVDSHIRSLMTGHLADVPSSDHHTVKPWFQGRLNFSPPVPDLKADGFTLDGGRVDVVAGRPAAALVYRRRQHVINLWIVPSDGAGTKPQPSQVDGYNILRWNSGAFAWWAVSDLNAAELGTFADLIRGASRPSR